MVGTRDAVAPPVGRDARRHHRHRDGGDCQAVAVVWQPHCDGGGAVVVAGGQAHRCGDGGDDDGCGD